MGSVYAVLPGGKRSLVCDICSGAGARKRRCPAGYCPAWDVHAACLKGVKAAWVKAHENCAAAMAESEAYWDAVAAEPARYVKSAVGSWHEGVPEGMVGVWAHDGAKYLMPAEAYRSHHYREPLFPHSEAVAWEGAPA